jgi:hypothetical protein
MLSERTLTLTQIYQAASSVCVAAVCAWLWPQAFSGICAGAVLMALNFWALRLVGKRLFGPQASPKKATYAVMLLMKQVAALVLMSVVLMVLKPDIAGLAVGMTTVFAGILLSMLHQAVWPQKASAA